VFGYELNPSSLGKGNISWINEGEPVWRITEQAVAANSSMDLSQRPISEHEPAWQRGSVPLNLLIDC